MCFADHGSECVKQLQATFCPKLGIESGDAQGRDMQGHGCLRRDLKRDSAGAPHSIPAEMVLWDLTLPFVRAGSLFRVGWLGSGGALGSHRKHLAPDWGCIVCSLNPKAAGFLHLYSSKMPAHNPARDSLYTWMLQTSIKAPGERLGTCPLTSHQPLDLHQPALRNVSSGCKGHFSTEAFVLSQCWVTPTLSRLDCQWRLVTISWLPFCNRGESRNEAILKKNTNF